jgi:hypothetical protein
VQQQTALPAAHVPASASVPTHTRVLSEAHAPAPAAPPRLPPSSLHSAHFLPTHLFTPAHAQAPATAYTYTPTQAPTHAATPSAQTASALAKGRAAVCSYFGCASSGSCTAGAGAKLRGVKVSGCPEDVVGFLRTASGEDVARRLLALEQTVLRKREAHEREKQLLLAALARYKGKLHALSRRLAELGDEEAAAQWKPRAWGEQQTQGQGQGQGHEGGPE